MKIIPGTHDRAINSPFPFLSFCEKLANGMSSLPFCLGFFEGFIYLFLEKGEGKEQEREGNTHVRKKN